MTLLLNGVTDANSFLVVGVRHQHEFALIERLLKFACREILPRPLEMTERLRTRIFVVRLITAVANIRDVNNFLSGVAFLHPAFILTAGTRMAQFNGFSHQLKGAIAPSDLIFLEGGAIQAFRDTLLTFAAHFGRSLTIVQEVRGVTIVPRGGTVIFIVHRLTGFHNFTLGLGIVGFAAQFFRRADIG